MGLGGAWHEREHAAFGVEFGSGFGERLDWLEEALQVIRPLLHGEEVTHDGPRYRADHLRLDPPPVQAHMPIMVGGTGERKTLRSVARHADMWNAQSPLDGHPAQARRAAGRTARPRVATPPPSSSPTTARSSSATATTEAQAVLDAPARRQHDGPRRRLTRRSGRAPSRSIAERLAAFAALGFRTFTIEELAPFDRESLERLIGEVKPLLERG